MGFMKAEVPFDPETLKSDEERFTEIDRLLAEGWRFKGNFFDKDQTYRLVIRDKDNDGERSFRTARPYPKIVDEAGRIKNIP